MGKVVKLRSVTGDPEDAREVHPRKGHQEPARVDREPSGGSWRSKAFLQERIAECLSVLAPQTRDEALLDAVEIHAGRLIDRGVEWRAAYQLARDMVASATHRARCPICTPEEPDDVPF